MAEQRYCAVGMQWGGAGLIFSAQPVRGRLVTVNGKEGQVYGEARDGYVQVCFTDTSNVQEFKYKIVPPLD